MSTKTKKPLEARNKNLALNPHLNTKPMENKVKPTKKKIYDENRKISNKENKSSLIIKKENEQLKNQCASKIQKFFRIYQKEKALKKLQEAKLKLAGSIAKLDSTQGKQNDKENKDGTQTLKVPTTNQIKEDLKGWKRKKNDDKKGKENLRNLDISDILVKDNKKVPILQEDDHEAVLISKISNI